MSKNEQNDSIKLIYNDRQAIAVNLCFLAILPSIVEEVNEFDLRCTTDIVLAHRLLK